MNKKNILNLPVFPIRSANDFQYKKYNSSQTPSLLIPMKDRFPAHPLPPAEHPQLKFKIPDPLPQTLPDADWKYYKAAYQRARQHDVKDRWQKQIQERQLQDKIYWNRFYIKKDFLDQFIFQTKALNLKKLMRFLQDNSSKRAEVSVDIQTLRFAIAEQRSRTLKEKFAKIPYHLSPSKFLMNKLANPLSMEKTLGVINKSAQFRLSQAKKQNLLTSLRHHAMVGDIKTRWVENNVFRKNLIRDYLAAKEQYIQKSRQQLNLDTRTKKSEILQHGIELAKTKANQRRNDIFITYVLGKEKKLAIKQTENLKQQQHSYFIKKSNNEFIKSTEEGKKARRHIMAKKQEEFQLLMAIARKKPKPTEMYFKRVKLAHYKKVEATHKEKALLQKEISTARKDLNQNYTDSFRSEKFEHQLAGLHKSSVKRTEQLDLKDNLVFQQISLNLIDNSAKYGGLVKSLINATKNIQKHNAQKALEVSLKSTDENRTLVQNRIEQHELSVSALQHKVLDDNSSALLNERKKLINLELTKDFAAINLYHQYLDNNYLQKGFVYEKIKEDELENNRYLAKVMEDDIEAKRQLRDYIFQNELNKDLLQKHLLAQEFSRQINLNLFRNSILKTYINQISHLHELLAQEIDSKGLKSQFQTAKILDTSITSYNLKRKQSLRDQLDNVVDDRLQNNRVQNELVESQTTKQLNANKVLIENAANAAFVHQHATNLTRINEGIQRSENKTLIRGLEDARIAYSRALIGEDRQQRIINQQLVQDDLKHKLFTKDIINDQIKHQLKVNHKMQGNYNHSILIKAVLNNIDHKLIADYFEKHQSKQKK